MKDFEYDVAGYKALKGEKALKERLKGRLPIMDIKGQPFFVDVRGGYLRPMLNFLTKGINIDNKKADPKTLRITFYYHVPSMTEFIVKPGIKELPKDVVMVDIPNHYHLDPIGKAQSEGVDALHYYERAVTLRMYRKANITQLKNSPLVNIVKNNQRAVEGNKTVKQSECKKSGKRRGKRI